MQPHHRVHRRLSAYVVMPVDRDKREKDSVATMNLSLHVRILNLVEVTINYLISHAPFYMPSYQLSCYGIRLLVLTCCVTRINPIGLPGGNTSCWGWNTGTCTTLEI